MYDSTPKNPFPQKTTQIQCAALPLLNPALTGRGGGSNILRVNDIQTPPLFPPCKGRVQAGKGSAVFRDIIGFRSGLLNDEPQSVG